MNLHQEIQQIGADWRRAHGQEVWQVVDPARVNAGYFGTTFHATKAEAEERCRMFPGSVMRLA